MIWGANGISFLIKIIQGASLSSQISIMALLQYYIVPLILLSMIYSGCLQFLSKMGTPRTSEPDGKGQLIDPGHDLNMNGMARRVKLVIILTAIPQILLLFYPNYFWLAPFVALITIFCILIELIIKKLLN